jgi:hypothetical protein
VEVSYKEETVGTSNFAEYTRKPKNSLLKYGVAINKLELGF